ncbi:MAG: helical backbone metal receptor [Elusimicrobiota bacterium]
MLRRLIFLFFCLLVISSLAFSAVTYDATGEEWDTSRKVNRIVSLVPSITEEIYLLKKDYSLVGVTNYCKHPGSAQAKEKVGTLLSPNIEAIKLLKPDMVFASKENQAQELVEKLREMNVPVFVFGEILSYEDIELEFMQLAEIFGMNVEAEKIMASLEKKMNDITKRVDKKNIKRSVFCELGHEPLVTVAKGSYIDELIARAGGVNIARSSKARYPQYNIEEVIKSDPDIIIIINMDDISQWPKDSWLKYKDMNAVKNNNIYELNADDICRPSINGYVDAYERLVSIFEKAS